MAAEAASSSPAVDYVWLSPNCGLKVSNICLGTMTFGGAASESLQMLPKNADEATSHKILDRFFELGGNFLDTANIYTSGESEQIIGSWLSRQERSKVILATKVGAGGVLNAPSPNNIGLSRACIMSNCDKSLRRLQTDYIDLYYSHQWDAGVKIEESLRAFNDLVRAGKVRYLGVSNFTGAQLQKVVDYSKFMGLDERVVIQEEYNLLERHAEQEVIPTCLTEGVAVIPYCALKGGLLTGKFKREDANFKQTLAGTRLAWVAEKPKERGIFGSRPQVENYRDNEDYWKLMDAIHTIGKEHGKTASQVSIRWLLEKKFVSSVLIGTKSMQQLEECMGAGTGWKLSDDEMKQLDDLSSFTSPHLVYPYTNIARLNAGRLRP